MEVELIRANPAGNITLLVTSPVPKERYAETAGKLMALPELGGEQVGFFTKPKLSGEARLEMMGGEFCGNALRSAGYARAARRGIPQPAELLMECSGCSKVLTVRADTKTGEADADMPLPKRIEAFLYDGVSYPVVLFEGIAHAICLDCEPDRRLAAGLTETLVRHCGVSAAGVMFLDRARMFMRPAVFVSVTRTLVFESSCASGSAAAAVFLSGNGERGAFWGELRQPGGVIRAGAERSNGLLKALTIGGPVRLEPERKIRLKD